MTHRNEWLRALAGLAAGAVLALIGAQATATPLCETPNGMFYDGSNLFDPAHACYVAPHDLCPPPNSACANMALAKLANYKSQTQWDLLFAPHRGLWGSTYATKDTAISKPPGQNTGDAFKLAKSFTDTKDNPYEPPPFGINKQGRNYGQFLRGRLIEVDVTTYGDDVLPQPLPIVDHYLTTDNTVLGSINDYTVDLTAQQFHSFDGYLERRDFSNSESLLRDMSVEAVTRAVIVDKDPRFGAIAFLDVKARRGKIQCQTYNLQPGTPEYEEYKCKYGERSEQFNQSMIALKLAAEAMYDAGGTRNIVLKTPSTYDQTVHYFGIDNIGKYMWQPHFTGAKQVGLLVQYIHDWLYNAPKSVLAWEMNIYWDGDYTNQSFCVTDFIPAGHSPADYPYGQVVVKLAKQQTPECKYGFYINMLHYVAANTGNPDYFGFTPEQKQQHLISGNRANMWLLDTASAAGTSDREYRWQMLGSERTYDMSDAMKSLNYPYAAYQILTGDRLGDAYQVWVNDLYPHITLADAPKLKPSTAEAPKTDPLHKTPDDYDH